MSVGLSTALIIGGVAAAAGSVGSAVIGSNAAGNAANAQQQAAQQAAAREQPWVNAGQTALSQLMEGFGQSASPATTSSGPRPFPGPIPDILTGTGLDPANIAAWQQYNATGGPSGTSASTSTGAPSQNSPAIFGTPIMPTLQEAEATPGYQFAQQQGMRAVTAAGSQAGNSLGGATLKAAEQFGTGLANSTYNDVFNRQLASNNQAFQQLFAVSNQGQNAATNVGNLMVQGGNAQAAGIVGQANAITGGIQGVTGDVSQNLLLSKILAGGAGANTGVTMPSPASLANAGALTVPDVGTFGTATGYGPG